MKIQKSDIAALALFLCSCAAFLIFNADYFTFLSDETANKLLCESVSRCIAAVCYAAVCVVLGCKSSLVQKNEHLFRNLLWCLPCLFVALVNFPFSALANGSAQVERSDLIALFLFKCFSIGLMEEILFRGLLQTLLKDLFRTKKKPLFLTVAATSALFGLFHLANLFGGASLPATLLQAGYSFLLGAMFSAVTLKTGTVWTAVLLHTLFDVGGLLISDLGRRCAARYRFLDFDRCIRRFVRSARHFLLEKTRSTAITPSAFPIRAY